MFSRILLTCFALLTLGSAAGCQFWRKDRKPKESSELASEVEASFRQRWIDQRVAQLTAQGEAPDYARGQAAREFDERYDFNKRPKQ